MATRKKKTNKTTTEYTKLRNNVKSYILRNKKIGLDVNSLFGFDISAFDTAQNILKASTRPSQYAWHDVQNKTKELSKEYKKLQQNINHLKKSALGKYDTYYDEFEKLSKLLSNNVSFIGRYPDETVGTAEKNTSTINDISKKETLLRNKLQRIAREIGKQQKLSGYTQGESGRIICGYYLAVILGDSIPTNPDDLSYYTGTHLTKTLARLFWNYNDNSVWTPITEAYNTLNDILDDIRKNALPAFQSEELHIDKVETVYDEELYDEYGDVINPY